MKRLKLIICCAVILGTSYAFGASTMTHTWAVIDAAITTFLTMDTAAELEALLSLQNLQGAVTDSQVPNDITINYASAANTATTATTATTGDSATSFFASGTMEAARLPEFSGTGGSGIVPDPTTDDGRLLDTGGWTNTVPVDISGYGPSMAVYSDSSGKIETHPTISSQELAQLDGYNVAAGTVEERFGALAAGEMTLAITIGGEISNEIAATLQVQKAGVAYSENAMLRTWLSASSGGIPSSAFDGDSGDPWVVSDSTVMQTASANYDETVLTGADGDCVITMAHSDAASPATKYLCAEYKNTVSCGEVTFSADSTPCAANDNLSQTLDEYEWTAVYSSYLSQKIDGSLIPTGTWKVCKVVAVMRRGSTGTNPDVHLEFWTEGTSNAGRNMSTAQVNGDSDSETLSSTSDTTIEFTWTSNNPEITGGTNYFMHRAVETDGEAPAYWIGTQNENSFSDTNFDAFGSGTTDLSGDVYFVIYLESV